MEVFADTIQAVLVRNERPVGGAFRDAAKQIYAINASYFPPLHPSARIPGDNHPQIVLLVGG